MWRSIKDQIVEANYHHMLIRHLTELKARPILC